MLRMAYTAKAVLTVNRIHLSGKGRTASIRYTVRRSVGLERRVDALRSANRSGSSVAAQHRADAMSARRSRKTSARGKTTQAVTASATNESAGAASGDVRLAALRAEMAKCNDGKGVDAYIIPSDDPHQSEYVAECFARRAYISSFTAQGSPVSHCLQLKVHR
ncbi:hypothetical protein CYMTET_38725, partial [Cymbomonas tetramitiformis]